MWGDWPVYLLLFPRHGVSFPLLYMVCGAGDQVDPVADAKVCFCPQTPVASEAFQSQAVL